MSIAVRQAALSDADIIAPLFDQYRQFYRQESHLALARAFIVERLARHESVIFLAENTSHEAVGFTQLFPSFTSVGVGRIWVLNDLYVVPAARRHGVGSILLETARAHAAATGCKRIELSTAHDNPARKLYESHGYTTDDGFIHYSLPLG
ncbi:MAG TPA: GNAT family N-acetyltransferase [Noviherbaspirillum sp.]|nr:GNAT family N-acetyltransferase [Noviherbaspirillum sp.]